MAYLYILYRNLYKQCFTYIFMCVCIYSPLEKEKAIHFSILAWQIPWTEEFVGLQSMGSQKSWTRLSGWAQHSFYLVSILILGAHPGYHLIFSYNISLGSSRLGKFLRLLLFLMTLMRNTGQVFCTMSFNLGLSDAFLMARWGYGIQKGRLQS